MANIFNSVKERLVGSSRFNLSHEVKTTFNMAELLPIFCQEVLPGDKWQLQSEMMIRLQPMLAPVMHRVNCYVHYFFVPTRLIFEDYEAFFDPKRTQDIIMPNIYIPRNYLNTKTPYHDYGITVSREREIFGLLDSLGVPVRYNTFNPGNPYESDELRINALPFYAYALIYNEYYRDQNLEPDLLETYPHGLRSGDEFDLENICSKDESYYDDLPQDFSGGTAPWFGLRRRAWEKDYFTSALPDPQVGEEVHLPLQGTAPVIAGDGTTNFDFAHEAGKVYGQYPVIDDTNKQLRAMPSSGSGSPINIVNGSNGQTNLYADMSQVSATTINELRRASRLQEFLERTARGGRRYKEMIASHFGVFSKDARLDRPEFLGGGMQPVVIDEVLSHVGDDGQNNFILGQMGGHGISVGQSARTRRRFTEHGYLFAIASVMPRTAYMDGLPRMFSKLDMYDFYWPEFARIGEQEILNKEVTIFSDGHLDPNGTFGYAPRYSEYKYIPGSVHGEFRGSLDYWHLARKMGTRVALNVEFVHPNPDDLSRIFAVETGADQLLAQIYHKCVAIRKMPKYGVPTL